MSDALKPCPFCGGEAALIEDSSHSTAYSVGCFNRDCDIEPYDWQKDVTKATAAWNTRADLPATDAQIKANPKVQALLSYAGHRRRCNLMSAFVEGKACTCGYDAALAALGADT